jgi:hypothetical protein
VTRFGDSGTGLRVAIGHRDPLARPRPGPAHHNRSP